MNIYRPNGFVADEYKVSEKMSTYLLAFIVCDFKKLTGKTKNNITVSQYNVGFCILIILWPWQWKQK